MKKKVLIPSIILIIISIFLLKYSFLENVKIFKYSQLNKQKTFLNGEWYDIKDSTSGISIRGNKIAFFKNSTFSSENIYDYKLIDSLHKSENKKTKIGEFIMMSQISKDTIYKKILTKNDSLLVMKIDNENKTFKRKGLIKFREK